MIEVLEEPLKAFFGYNHFRPYQKEIVEACLSGEDVLAILPTGAGKSICYQLPALLLPGVTIVVSPLISLMQDQVVALTKNNLSAAYINSTLPSQELQHILSNLSKYKLLYIAPERLSSPEFMHRLSQIQVSLFAIDEAHCISQWGHAFRPEYRQLSLLKKTFPNTPIIALTATATREVEKDISAELHLKNPFLTRATFDRPNLLLRARPRAKGELLSFLKKHKDKSGIIYCATRKGVEENYELLLKEGYTVGKYHAGLNDAEKSKMQHEFVYGETPLMVATVAFGMGINKPDVRFIVHTEMPKSIEQYYQEIGRAGRDGLPSECLMLYSAQELITYDFFIKKIDDPIIQRMTKAKTRKMVDYCHSSNCRRIDLLRYFGEEFKSSNCGACDVCVDDVELIDATLIAQKILSCVYRLEQKFGMNYVIEVLRGVKSKPLLERGHDSLSTFNLMPDTSEADLRHYINALIEKGYLCRSEGEYPVLLWTETTKTIVKGETPIVLRSPPVASEKVYEKPRAKERELECDDVLFQELSKLRKKFAKDLEIPEFVVFPDKTLIEMAQKYPTTKDELLQINGVSPAKWDKFGSAMLHIIVNYCHKSNITPAKISTPIKPIKKSAAKSTHPLFEELSQLRKKLAQEISVPAFVVFADKVLIDMTERKPKSREEFLEIHGVGPAKWDKFGAAFLEVIQKPSSLKSCQTTYSCQKKSKNKSGSFMTTHLHHLSVSEKIKVVSQCKTSPFGYIPNVGMNRILALKGHCVIGASEVGAGFFFGARGTTPECVPVLGVANVGDVFQFEFVLEGLIAQMKALYCDQNTIRVYVVGGEKPKGSDVEQKEILDLKGKFNIQDYQFNLCEEGKALSVVFTPTDILVCRDPLFDTSPENISGQPIEI